MAPKMTQLTIHDQPQEPMHPLNNHGIKSNNTRCLNGSHVKTCSNVDVEEHQKRRNKWERHKLHVQNHLNPTQKKHHAMAPSIRNQGQGLNQTQKLKNISRLNCHPSLDHGFTASLAMGAIEKARRTIICYTIGECPTHKDVNKWFPHSWFFKSPSTKNETPLKLRS